MMSNKWSMINSWVHKIRLHGRRGKETAVCSFGLRGVHCLAQRSSRVLFNTFIKGHVRKNENREEDKERVKERASISKSSA